MTQSAATDYSKLLVSELCAMTRELKDDAEDCLSPARRARINAELAEIAGEMRARGFIEM